MDITDSRRRRAHRPGLAILRSRVQDPQVAVLVAAEARVAVRGAVERRVFCDTESHTRLTRRSAEVAEMRQLQGYLRQTA